MNPLAYRLLVMTDAPPHRWTEVAVLDSRQAAARKLRECRAEDARRGCRRKYITDTEAA